MRISFAIIGLALLGTPSPLLTPAAAQAPTYQWCVQPSGPRGPDCYYSTLEQCRASASAVGFCYENPAYTVATRGKPQRAR